MSRIHSVSTGNTHIPQAHTPLTALPRPRRSTVSNVQSEKISGLPRSLQAAPHFDRESPSNFGTSPRTSRLPKPMSTGTPSKLHRPQETPPQHRHSVSLSVATPTETSSFARRSCGAIISTSTPPYHRPSPSMPSLHAPSFRNIETSPPRRPMPQKPRAYTKDDPRTVLKHLACILGPSESPSLQELLVFDVLLALHEREEMEAAARLHRARSIEAHADTGADRMYGQMLGNSGSLNVFGVALRQISLYASTKAVLGGYEHELPILVFACVEQLYRTGLSTILDLKTVSSSATSPASTHADSHSRIHTLVEIFNSASHNFGFHTSLASESSSDVYKLLSTFLSQLPEPILAPAEIELGLKEALWTWCVKPKPSTSTSAPTSTSNRSPLLGNSILNPHDPERRVRLAQLLLRLLPSPNLSLFVYMMAFACQIHLAHVRNHSESRMKERTQAQGAAGTDADLNCCPPQFAHEMSSIETQLLALERELEDERFRETVAWQLGRTFGKWMFGFTKRREREREHGEGFMYVVEDEDEENGEEERTSLMMVWFINHWREIIRGFFEGPEAPTSSHNPNHHIKFAMNNQASPLLRPTARDDLLHASQTRSTKTHAHAQPSGSGRGTASSIAMTTESLLSSSPSFVSMESSSRLSGAIGPTESEGRVDSGGAQNVTNANGAADSEVRMGLVRGKSYGEAIFGPSTNECSASIHSGRELDDKSEQCNSAAPNMSSTTSVDSALDERLLDAASDSKSIYLHLPEMSLSLSRIASVDFSPVQDAFPDATPSRSSSSTNSDESQELALDERYKRPLHVVNPSPVESFGEEEIESDDPGSRFCCRCDFTCVVHAYAKELEERLQVVTKERDDALRAFTEGGGRLFL